MGKFSSFVVSSDQTQSKTLPLSVAIDYVRTLETSSTSLVRK